MKEYYLKLSDKSCTKTTVESAQSDAKWEQGGSSTGHFFSFLIFSAEDS